VTSPNPGDGKSTTAANLAVSLAQAGKRVVLLDADFRKPRVHKIFALDRPEIGLASVLDGSTRLDAAIRPSDVDNLFLLPCGPRPANPAELLAGNQFTATLAELRDQFDHVIIDTPPLLVVSDPLVVAQRAEAVVLVFGITRRSRQQVERAKELLADTGANLIGVVVNGMDGPAGSYGYSAGSYKYGYNYEYQYTEQYADDASRT
jgi:polysaccharide biosynthesis transport protein